MVGALGGAGGCSVSPILVAHMEPPLIFLDLCFLNTHVCRSEENEKGSILVKSLGKNKAQRSMFWSKLKFLKARQLNGLKLESSYLDGSDALGCPFGSMLLQGCSRTRGHGYYSSTWSCSCGLFISNNTIKPSEVPCRFPFAAPLFDCSKVREPLCVYILIWSWNSSLIYCTSGLSIFIKCQSQICLALSTHIMMFCVYCYL